MTPEEQERVDGIRSNNATLRLKLQAVEEENKQIPGLAVAVDEFRNLYFRTLEKLNDATRRLAVAAVALEQAGIVIPPAEPVKADEGRELANDQRTRTIEKGFTR